MGNLMFSIEGEHLPQHRAAWQWRFTFLACNCETDDMATGPFSHELHVSLRLFRHASCDAERITCLFKRRSPGFLRIGQHARSGGQHGIPIASSAFSFSRRNLFDGRKWGFGLHMRGNRDTRKIWP
jgi:hypothetical protein